MRPLAERLLADGDAVAVRDLAGRELVRYDLDGAGVLVLGLDRAPPSELELEALRLAERQGVPRIALVRSATAEPVQLPYVLATDVLSVLPGETVPFERVVERIAAAAAERADSLAAHLPALRGEVSRQIVRAAARQNGLIGAAVFIPGAHLPVLTLNQIRMLLRLAVVYGEEVDRERALEVAGVVAAGVGLRTLARELAGVVPGAGWAVKGAIAYAGTRTLGEAAARYFAEGGTGRLIDAVRRGS